MSRHGARLRNARCEAVVEVDTGGGMNDFFSQLPFVSDTGSLASRSTSLESFVNC
jgi:hypothetical protein